jgi:hypothetical protein
MRRSLAILSGLLAIVACVCAIFVWFAAPYAQALSGLKPLPLLLGVLAAVPLSVFSGVYWKRSLFGVTVLAVGMLLYVGLRLH